MKKEWLISRYREAATESIKKQLEEASNKAVATLECGAEFLQYFRGVNKREEVEQELLRCKRIIALESWLTETPAVHDCPHNLWWWKWKPSRIRLNVIVRENADHEEACENFGLLTGMHYNFPTVRAITKNDVLRAQKFLMDIFPYHVGETALKRETDEHKKLVRIVNSEVQEQLSIFKSDTLSDL
ncbi:hypothetical protein [Senimuribacter intestinalis]|uniref:hypothetical protein n=1 Tax=Senimuribacter intestinalis TaxID=2941507 RepID=UPI00204221FB|nr:hypothetical protein [Senimuribacter intestinalis]